MVERHGKAGKAAERMDDRHRLIDPERFRRPAQRGGLNRRRGAVTAAEPVAPAMARTVGAENPEPCGGEPVGEREEEVGRVAGGAVEHEDRAALFSLRRPVEHMDGPAADLDARPARRIARLDAARLNGGERAEDADQDQKGDQAHKGKRDRHAGSGTRAETRSLTAPVPRPRP